MICTVCGQKRARVYYEFVPTYLCHQCGDRFGRWWTRHPAYLTAGEALPNWLRVARSFKSVSVK